MKFNINSSFLVILFLILILNLNNFSNGQTGDYKMVSETIKRVALYNYYVCYGDYLEENQLCGPGKYICEYVQGSDNVYTIIGIDFSKPNIPLDYPSREWCYVENIALFTNLTTIYVNSKDGRMRGNGAAFTNFIKLPKLKKVTYRYVDEFDHFYHTALPDSLEELYMGTVTDYVAVEVFQAKLKILEIENLTSTLPILTNENQYLESLKIGISSSNSFSTSISESFSKNLISLKDLNLYYYNNIITDVPLISNYLKLENLEIDSDSKFTTTSEFPTNPLFKSNLKSLSLGGNLFTFNNGFDFSSTTNEGFKFSINGYTTFSNCSKCLKFPIGTIIELNGNFELDSIDFTNVYYFTSNLNKIDQELPELLDITINYNKLKSFKIINSDVYGTVPESYCQLPLDYSLINNQLSNFPQCFICDLNSRSKITPNPLYIYSNIDYCSTFTFNQVNNLLPTSGGILEFNGTLLGWEYIMNDNDNSKVLLDIPNFKFSIPISKGVGSSFKNQITFNGFINKTIEYGFISPTISSVTVIEINNTKVLIVYGDGFDYIGMNSATITNTIDKTTITTQFDNQIESNSYITSISSNVLSKLSTSINYQIYFMIGDQQSNTIEFSIIDPTTSTSTSSSTTTTSSTDTSTSSSTTTTSTTTTSSSTTTSTSSNSDELEEASKSTILKIFLNLNIVLLLILLLL